MKYLVNNLIKQSGESNHLCWPSGGGKNGLLDDTDGPFSWKLSDTIPGP